MPRTASKSQWEVMAPPRRIPFAGRGWIHRARLRVRITVAELFTSARALVTNVSRQPELYASRLTGSQPAEAAGDATASPLPCWQQMLRAHGLRERAYIGEWNGTFADS
jgi:hypothetical protein